MVVEAVVETFGPFLIPVLLFVGGGLVYAVLVVLGRRGLLPGDAGRSQDGESDDAGRND